jgi:tetratricopeptide (TPR) repeat protein
LSQDQEESAIPTGTAEPPQPLYKSLFKKGIDAVVDASTSAAETGGKIAGQTLSIASEATVDVSALVAETGSKLIERTVANAKYFSSTNHAQWFGDDAEQVGRECGLLNDWSQTRFPSQVTSAAFCAAAGLGILTSATEITRVTRALMDNDRGVLQTLLRSFFNPEAAQTISRWMDTVLTQGFSGGMFHRLAHGHDLGGLLELVRQHNLTGALEWFNHVALRDFWTPHGVPYLPFGSQSIFDWLVSLGVRKTTAMSLLSLNAAQAGAALLAYKASRSAVEYVRAQLRKRKAQRLWDRAQSLEETNDYESADLCYDEALSYAPDSLDALIWVSIRALERAREAENAALWRRHNDRCYQLADAVRLRLSAADQVIPFSGGTRISLRGLAATLMAVSWSGGRGDQEDAIEGLRGILSGAVSDLLVMAEKLRAGDQVPGLEKTFLRARPFSAVLNESLALQLLTASPQPLPTPHTPITVHKRVTDTLKAVISQNDSQSAYAGELLEGFMRKYPLAGLGRLTT